MLRPAHPANVSHRAWVRACLFGALVSTVGAWVADVRAHEIGTTRVVAAFTSDGTYRIDVTADASAILARLEMSRQRPRSRAETPEELQRAFDAICDDVPLHVAISFAGEPSVPQATCTVDREVAGDAFEVPGVTATLRGRVPVGATTFRWRYDLAAASYSLTVSGADREGASTVWLEGGQTSDALAFTLATPSSRLGVARTYFVLGFTHILPKGLDHILFVLGLCLLSRRANSLLWQVSAFTVAHSITLGLALYGIITLPSSVVEPLIALSIVYVAIENLVSSSLRPWRVVLVFAFGLLHGLGFAGILSSLALPPSEFLTGLLAFNMGVEAGQLAVIAGAFLLVGSWATRHARYRELIVMPASAAIALTGLFWTIERLS